MIIYHDLPTKKFVRMDKFVFLNHALSDGAVRLYGYLCSMRDGAVFTDDFIIRTLGISRNVLARRKKELKDQNLLLIAQVQPRVFMAFVGHSKRTAEQVKNTWMEQHDL